MSSALIGGTVPRARTGAHAAAAVRGQRRSTRRDDRLLEAFADPPPAAASPATRDFLERAAGFQSRAAAIFRANRMGSEAARAEQFAARLRLMLDEPKATSRMHGLTQDLYDAPHAASILERALEGAMALIGGDFGNVQLSDLTNGRLRIAAQHGFGQEFLDYFAIVEDDTSACGRAASQHVQTVIVDVNRDPAFAPHRAIASASRFRAVQSTPLVDPTGRLRGVISTHFRRAQQPSSRDLQLIQWYAEHVASALADRQNRSIPLHELTAALHGRTAALHDTAAVRIDESARALLTNGNGTSGLAIQEWAHLARERARQERERARALTERVQHQNGRYASPRRCPNPQR